MRKSTPPYPCISARNIFHYTRMSLTPLRPRPPNAPLSAPPRAPETDAERRARHLNMLREMAELAMEVARHAAAKATSPDPATADAPDPGLTFARATRAARQAIALETRIAAGDLPSLRQPRPANDPAAAPDPRRAHLRQALHKAARAEPGRPALRRDIDISIERELGADPEAEIATGEILAKLSNQLGLPFDPSLLPDHFLTVGPTRSRDPSFAAPVAPDGAGAQPPKRTTSWTAQDIRDPSPAASAANPTHADPPKPNPFHRRE